MAQLRGAKVVEVIFAAAAEELAARGYADFSIEGVAERAGVNKTTVYRRWPTKDELLRAALAREGEALFRDPAKGSLVEDLVVVAGRLTAFLRTPHGRALHALIVLAPDRDLTPDRDRREARAIFERAVARGELPAGSDVGLLSSSFFAVVMVRALLGRTTPSAATHRKTLALLLAGNEKRAAER
jgi:AcrR family transcriptional regulator